MARYPQKAVKKIKNSIHREIAVGHLIAYGLFPRTREGIAAAEKLIDSRDTWLAPSDLPNYYADIESDLITGKETAGIVNIRMILKDFYKVPDNRKSEKKPPKNKPLTPKLPEKKAPEGKTTVYKPEDKFVDDIQEELSNKLEETSNEILDAIDELIEQQKREYEEFKEKLQEEIAEKTKAAESINSDQYPEAIGPDPMFGPKEPERGLIGTRKILTPKEIAEKYGIDPQAPVPAWGNDKSESDDDWESEVPDQLGTKLDELIDQVRNEPLPKPKKTKKKGKKGKTPLGSTKRYDFDPETVSNKKKLNLILENIIETRKALFQLYKINKARFEFKKTVDKRLTRDLEAKQREKAIEKGPKKDEETLIVRLGKKAKATLLQSIIAGFTAGAIGLVNNFNQFIDDLKQQFPFLFPQQNQNQNQTGSPVSGTGGFLGGSIPRVNRNQSNQNQNQNRPGNRRTWRRGSPSTTNSGPLSSSASNYTPVSNNLFNTYTSNPTLLTNNVLPTSNMNMPDPPPDNRNLIDQLLFPPAAAGTLPNGGYPSASNVSKQMNEKYTLNFLATAGVAALEAGNDQARADVAQSIFNRYDDLKNFEGYRDYLGASGKSNYDLFAGTAKDNSIAYMVLKENQYQPVWEDPTKGFGVASSKWMNILNANDPFNAIVDAMQDTLRKKKDPRGSDRSAVAQLLLRSIAAIDNPENMKRAAAGVGGRTEFLGSYSRIAASEQAETFRRGKFGDSVNNQFFGAYGTNSLNNRKIKQGAAPIPSGVLFKPKPQPSVAPNPNNNKKITTPTPKLNPVDWVMQIMRKLGIGGSQPGQQSSVRIDTSSIATAKSFAQQPPQQPLN